MFITVIIYFICVFLIWWSYAGYFFYLFIYYLLRRGTQFKFKASRYPDLTIIVPVYEEEKLIVNKIKNLKSLNYPGKLEFLLVDGGSQDGTLDKINNQIKNLANYQLINSSKGKIHQINTALLKARGEIIICTDVDALLPRKALQRLVAPFTVNRKIGVVGAYVMPKNSFPVEKEYWQEHNQIRLIESRVHSASIVIAPCYAFRKSLLKCFPTDCVADDIYLSFYAHSQNYLVKYLPDVLVYETRAPRHLLEFFTHKFRKANAYITELLRFIYTVNRFNHRSKIIYLSRFLQVIILPLVLLLFVAISLNLFIISAPYQLAVILTYAFLFFSVLLAAIIVNLKVFSLKAPIGKSKLLNLKIFLYTNFVLFFAIFTHFFYNQDSSYEKLNSTQ